MNNRDENRLIESAYMSQHRREVTAEDDVQFWMREWERVTELAESRLSTIVRLRHDGKIMLWTIVVLVASNLVAWRPWEWL